jgi:hypothetical protein
MCGIKAVCFLRDSSSRHIRAFATLGTVPLFGRLPGQRESWPLLMLILTKIVYT